MNLKLNPRRNSGLTIASVIILIVLLLVFIGTLFWMIWKAIQRIPTPRKDDSALIQQVVNDEVAALQAQHPGEAVTVQSVAVSYATQSVFAPFNPAAVLTTIERSTNLEHWEIVGTIQAGETFVDTNPPPIQAFYRYYYVR